MTDERISELEERIAVLTEENRQLREAAIEHMACGMFADNLGEATERLRALCGQGVSSDNSKLSRC